MFRLATASFPLLAAAATAQQALSTTFGPTVGGMTGSKVAVGTDFDGDGVADLLVASPFIGQGVIQVVSGDDNTVRSIVNSSGNFQSLHAIKGVPDLNLDGRGDIVMDVNGDVRAYSGATLAMLWATPGLNYRHCAPVGDRNGDGRCDLAVVTTTSPGELRLLSGLDGSAFAFFAVPGNSGSALENIGDLNGDGIPELARLIDGNSVVQILRLSNPSLLLTIPFGTASLAAANVAGDSRKEVLIGNVNTHEVRVYDASTGAHLLSWFQVSQGRFGVIGDLNADGFDEIALIATENAVHFVSGATGARVATWPGSAQFRPLQAAGGVDMNGDGFPDLVLGSEVADANGTAPPNPGGWQRLSGKILATMELKATNCYQGPWPPQIGHTLPRLGATTTVAGINAPTGTVGIVAWSVQPSNASNLGVAGCDAWFDLGAGYALAILHSPTPSWEFSLGIPLVPQLAGVPIAVQAVYATTGTPIGFDLTNGLWSRLGW